MKLYFFAIAVVLVELSSSKMMIDAFNIILNPTSSTRSTIIEKTSKSTTYHKSVLSSKRRQNHHVLSANDVDIHDNSDDEEDDDEEEEVEPGQMRVSEMKSELDLRGVDYSDCFDKESLTQRLIEARASGKANPEILDKFNKAKLEETFNEKKLEIKDEDLESITANDGTLPGGLSPETFQKMIGNPELMTLLQSTKMQEAMKLMMTGGPEELQAAIDADPELKETLGKLQEVMGELGPLDPN